MQGNYNLWLVAASYVVAVAASFAALGLGGRVVASQNRSVWTWIAGGSAALGLGIWSMHFIAMLAFHLPIPLAYDIPITLISVVPAILSSALVLGLVHSGGLHGRRMLIAAVMLGCGIAAMHYTGMAAIRISPAIQYQPWWFLASIAIAVAVAYAALRLAFPLSGLGSRTKKGVAALVMGGAIVAMHYTGMAAAQFAPDSLCTVSPTTIDNAWLGGMIAFSTGLILLVTVAIAAYDAHFADVNAQVVVALRSANEELARYYAAEEEEKRIAKELIDRLGRTPRDLAGSVDSWVLPAHYFSGDLVAVARTPTQALHVLVADGTGHGLSAALSALPVVQPFSAMSEKGCSISNIAREINSKIRATMPVGRFVAAAIASIDPRFGVISVWNGGCPAVHAIDAEGRSLKRFASRHLALGILDDAQFDARVESFDYEASCQLFLASDGLVEARNANEQAFGEDGMLNILAQALPSVRSRALRAAIHGHLGYRQPDDDISILMVECKRLTPGEPLAMKSSPADIGGRQGGCRVQITLGCRELQQLEVVPVLCSLLKELGLAAINTAQAFVVLAELFDNALDHGLLQMPSSINTGQDGFDAYVAERLARLQRLDSGSIEISIEYLQRDGQYWLKLRVQDSGRGFEYQPYLAASIGQAAESDPSRRGISLVRSLCTSVEYKDAGREAEVFLLMA